MNYVNQSKAKEKQIKSVKPKGKIKMEFDSVKGDFDTFLKDTKGGTYEEDFGDDDFM